MQARFDLIHTLSGFGRTQQAQAELLTLMQQMPPDPAIRKRVGSLLLQFGLAKESAEVFRDVLSSQNQDGEAYAGLGEADLALNDLLDARAAFRQAVRLDPGNDVYRQRLQLNEQIIALDPAMRGLAASERYRRSRKLMESALGALDQCMAAKPSAPPDAVRGIADQARKELLNHRAPRSYAEASDANIALADQLLAERQKLCGPPTPTEEPLSRAMALVAR